MAINNDLREEYRNLYFMIIDEVRNLERWFRANYNKDFHLLNLIPDVRIRSIQCNMEL
jgi:hypothetical protein